MKSKLRAAVVVLLVLGMLAAAIGILRHQLDYRRSQQDYEHASSVAGVTSQPPEPEPEPQPEPEPEPGPSEPPDPIALQLAETDLEALRAVNPDVVGWILIPDTVISYPLLQSTDNSYYLNHTWEKKRNAGGSIFLECEVSADMSDFNTIVYGHRMANNSMFNSLQYYKDDAYRQEHPSVYIAFDGGVYRYDIFSAYEAPVRSLTYALGLTKQEHKESFVKYVLEKSVIDTGIVPTAEDRFLTLSTCLSSFATSDNRWVVIGVWHDTGVQMAPPAEPAPGEGEEQAA